MTPGESGVGRYFRPADPPPAGEFPPRSEVQAMFDTIADHSLRQPDLTHE